MGIINDMAEKMNGWNKPTIIAEDHADKLICRLCGKRYPSRGKWDCGICRDCEKMETKKNAHLIGGPLDGEKAYDEG